MLRYVARRLVVAFLTVFGVATIVFFGIRLVPGGVVQTLGGPQVARDPELREAWEDRYGLNRPVFVQYAIWVGNALQGDLGESLGTRASISAEIRRRAGVTIELSVMATLMSLVIGVPAGVLTAMRRGSVGDGVGRGIGLIGFSVPDFVLGTLLIYFVSTRDLGLPVSGYINAREDFWGHLRSLALPTLSLGVLTTAIVMRVVRSSVLDVLGEQYVTTARAKGLHPRIVARRHVLRAALIPMVTIVGINMGYLLSGAVVVEELFSLPGLGRYALQGIINRDYPIAQGTVVVGSLMFVFANLAADVLYGVIDPRIKY